MIRRFILLVGMTIAIVMMAYNSYALIGPIRILPSGNVLLVPNDEIKLTEEHLEFYHHPLGIWLVEYRALLKNLRFYEINRPVGFPSGYDLRTIEAKKYCDQFENFKVRVDDQAVNEIKFMTKCGNYVETTGTEWGVDDGSGVGFVNTWDIHFEPDQSRWITITFSMVVKKPPQIYDANNKETWFLDQLNWVHQDYESRPENYVQLPLNIGSFWAFYPDSITIRTYIADEWFKVVDKSDRKYEKDFIQRFEYCEPVGFFSPPEISLDTLSVSETEAMTTTELILLRNAFLAKYGKPFENKLIQKYFRAQPWYQENPEFNDWYLTRWDVDNIKMIDELLKARKN